jgi:cell division FtsZ-interacting protein ZapD
MYCLEAAGGTCAFELPPMMDIRHHDRHASQSQVYMLKLPFESLKQQRLLPFKSLKQQQQQLLHHSSAHQHLLIIQPVKQ